MPDLTQDDLPKLKAAPKRGGKAAKKADPAPETTTKTTTETTPETTGTGGDVHVMLFGCDPHELSPEVVGDEFSTLRATDALVKTLKPGDRVDAYEAIKPYDSPTDDTDPDTGGFIGAFEVTGIETHIGLSSALQASAKHNHFCKMGRSITALEELIRRSYTESVIRSGKGWSVIHLKRV